MQNNRLEMFTDRREAIALFEYLRKNDPNRPWPLLPILTFVAPGGSGKSTLIEYLRARQCCLPDGRAVLPYAYLDFTRVDSPRDLLSILVALRDQLQAHGDGRGRNLNFPCFDLGAAIALATPRDGALPSFSAGNIQRRLTGAWPYFESLNEMGYALSNIIPIIPPMLAGLKSGVQTPALQDLLHHLEYSSGWHWYRLHGSEMGLSTDAGISDVLLRLYALSQPGKAGKQGRAYLVQQLLPAALLSDLRETLNSFNGPSAWNETTNVVLFLDGFDALLSGADAGSMGQRLLEMLALSEHRKRGENDPLLLVVGSQHRLLELFGVNQHGVFEDNMTLQFEYTPLVHSRALYEHWQQQLPDDKRSLNLRNLYLPLWLHDFDLDDTSDYLLKVGEQEQTSAFTVTGMVQAMHYFTHGHPLYLALAAASVLEAEAHARSLDSADFERDALSTQVRLANEDEAIAEYLCSLYLHQLSRQEEKNLIFCTVPRMLDIETLQVLVQLQKDTEIKPQWDHLRRLPFVRAIDGESIIFHPVIRDVILQRLPPDPSPESDYYRIHTHLREHFHRRNRRGESGEEWRDEPLLDTIPRMVSPAHARIDEAYHALALGDPEPAISLALFAQRTRLALWEPLLEAVTQAPTELMPEHTRQQAADTLAQAIQHHRIQDIVVALVLYTWLLTLSKRDAHETAEINNNLGAAYWTLTSGDRQANLEKAIACYQAALQVYTRDAFPADWATTQNNLGAAYWTLANGDRQDRQADLEKAIACCEAALQVYTRDAFPADWARTEYNLGCTYSDLPGGNRRENLEKAITCFECALQVYTREDFAVIWAKTNDSLGNAYLSLPSADQQGRQGNLQKAIACYKAAMEIYTRDTFPAAWARVQHRLGDAYRDLINADLQQENLERAIAFYQAALQVYTPGAFPTDWAEAQDSLGYTYASLQSAELQERQANLEKAIACYEAALQVYTRDAFPSNWASTQNNLGYAYAFLPGGDWQNRQANLQKAITCYEGALRVFQSLQLGDYVELVGSNLADAQDTLQQAGQD